jgi:hypothetical protein
MGLMVSFLLVGPVGAEESEPERFHVQHPPAGVSAAHTIGASRFAVGYAYERSHFDELRDRRDSIKASELLGFTGYTSAPSRLDVERHDVALMYAPSERITLMANLPILRKEMYSETLGGGFTTRSSGIGDLTLTAIAHFMQRDFEETFVHLEIGTPTGSIRERGAGARLPYPMQLGSGVWHLNPGLSYRGHSWHFTWGGQVSTLFRLGKNDLGYRPGNDYRVTGWLGREWFDGVATSLRIEWHRWENIHGDDPQLVPTATPVADPMAQKGERLDLGFGVDLRIPHLDQTLALEATLPLWEWLDGPQPSFDWRVRAGMRWML